MARIFRKNESVVLEGKGRYDNSDVTYSISNDLVYIHSESESKYIFNDSWQNIKNYQGQSFNSQNLLIEYLDSVFIQENIKQWVLDNYGEPDFNIQNDLITRLTF